MKGLALACILAATSCSPAPVETPEPAKSSAAEPPPRFSTFPISRAQLNKPVSPFEVHVECFTSSVKERMLTCVVLRQAPVASNWYQIQTDAQLIPDAFKYRWRVKGENGAVEREWMPFFMQNRDDTYHTIFRLPIDDLKRSELEIYFQDLDRDGREDDIRFVVDLSEFDWSPTVLTVQQSTGKPVDD